MTNDPVGARDPFSGREFTPELAGGPIRRLSISRVKITSRGVDVVVRHVARFGPDRLNEEMIERLREICGGRTRMTSFDLNFYTHELREFVRYRRRGWATLQPE